ncbi:helix-turn-helix transcriptional regulator [Phytomonospora endophytica]|uniref:Transcriptional regulator with XRE-family HTH domain n=1 Tax=Phytomonospora endophytica TaxID=714109 RepID=A0A841FNP5_9ACTN|nr:helix-turn-helix transcriptional regulator [Phytomonospora endophytica]MBB6037705.1 transcriptional regulator with XRE-family HTH domain [Phytomonospora endophytica]GIG67766.1 transcriptional regulator [Phytomonospora endophytica]
MARRRGLADRRAAMGLTQEDLAEALKVHVATVRRWEAGTSTPQPWVQPGLARYLNLSADQLQQFLSTENTTPSSEPATPAEEVRPASESPFLSALEIPVPRRLDLADAAQLGGLVDQFEQLDHAAGGRATARALALTHFNFAIACLNTASMTPAGRLAWMQVTGRLGRLCGFASADAGDHDGARRAFSTARAVAAEADDELTHLNILCGLIRQSVHLSDRTTSAELLGELQAHRLPESSLAQAALHAVEARVHGLLGRERQALLAIQLAEEAFTRGRSGNDPPWLWYYDEAQLAGDTAHALFPLALQGQQIENAVARFTRATALHLPSNARSLAFSATKLAILSVKWNSPDASDLIDKAIATTRRVSSTRADDDLRLLGQHLHQQRDTPHARRQFSEISQLLADR